MKILIVEDEVGIYTFLKEGLDDEGYQTEVATDGEMALEKYADIKPDLILLDWMIPIIDGLGVCNRIRETDTQTPILFLTAKDAVEDIISGLRAGANDYIKKPFSFDELLERIKIHFRNHKEEIILRLGDIEQNLTTYAVLHNGKEVKLTSREFDMLAYFIRHKGEVCTREDIIKNVWGIDFQYDTGVIDVFMNALRKKLDLKQNGYIKTVRGVGFIATD